MIPSIIARVIGLSPNEIEDTMLLRDDLGADDLDRMTIAVDLEVALGIELSDLEIARWEKVSCVANSVTQAQSIERSAA